jgi:hypothetical protein
MIQKHRCGKGFAGIVRYCLDQSRELDHEGAHLVDSNLAGRNADELARELEAIATLNRRVEKPVYHCSLRLAPGERVSDDTWRQITHEYLERMGFGEHAYLVVAHPGSHHDATAEHVHIVANRVPYDGGKAVSRSHDHCRADRIVRELEREYGLRRAREKDRVAERTLERSRERGWEDQ